MNLSRRGDDNIPGLVVAPISVNLGSVSFIVFACSAEPIVIEINPSSIAEYRHSSANRFMRCISSMNTIQFSDTLFKRDATSAGFSMLLPTVVTIWEHISFATIFANVVLPSPGGPYKRICGTGSFLFFADCIAICSDSQIFSWPM